MTDGQPVLHETFPGIYSSSVSKINAIPTVELNIVSSADFIYYKISPDTYMILKSKVIPAEGVISSRQLNAVIAAVKEQRALQLLYVTIKLNECKAGLASAIISTVIAIGLLLGAVRDAHLWGPFAIVSCLLVVREAIADWYFKKTLRDTKSTLP